MWYSTGLWPKDSSRYIQINLNLWYLFILKGEIKRMAYYIYKTTNNVNNKIYIGVHKSKDIKNDNYIGSGRLLKHSIEKYGIDKFDRKLLFEYDHKEEAYEKEAEIVDDFFIARLDTYNIMSGGCGGFDYINEGGLNGTLKGVAKRKLLAKEDAAWKEMFNKSKLEGQLKWRERLNEDPELYEEYREKLRAGSRLYFENGGEGSFKNKYHSEETKRKISKAMKGKHKGNKNSQFGTCWIMNESLKKGKKIKKDNLQLWIDKGWIKGRKIKF